VVVIEERSFCCSGIHVSQHMGKTFKHTDLHQCTLVVGFKQIFGKTLPCQDAERFPVPTPSKFKPYITRQLIDAAGSALPCQNRCMAATN
jgi:hypothetical protein